MITAAKVDGTMELLDAESGQLLKSTATGADFSVGFAVGPEGQVVAAVKSEPQAQCETCCRSGTCVREMRP